MANSTHYPEFLQKISLTKESDVNQQHNTAKGSLRESMKGDDHEPHDKKITFEKPDESKAGKNSSYDIQGLKELSLHYCNSKLRVALEKIISVLLQQEINSLGNRMWDEITVALQSVSYLIDESLLNAVVLRNTSKCQIPRKSMPRFSPQSPFLSTDKLNLLEDLPEKTSEIESTIHKLQTSLNNRSVKYRKLMADLKLQSNTCKRLQVENSTLLHYKEIMQSTFESHKSSKSALMSSNSEKDLACSRILTDMELQYRDVLMLEEERKSCNYADLSEILKEGELSDSSSDSSRDEQEQFSPKKFLPDQSKETSRMSTESSNYDLSNKHSKMKKLGDSNMIMKLTLFKPNK